LSPKGTNRIFHNSKFLKMIKYIELNSEDFKSAIEIVKNVKDNNRLLVRLNRKTYGGLITLDGTAEEIAHLCSILENNGIVP
jgi:hypothetical protein